MLQDPRVKVSSDKFLEAYLFKDKIIQVNFQIGEHSVKSI
jgi:hypothetical protein